MSNNIIYKNLFLNNKQKTVFLNNVEKDIILLNEDFYKEQLIEKICKKIKFITFDKTTIFNPQYYGTYDIKMWGGGGGLNTAKMDWHEQENFKGDYGQLIESTVNLQHGNIKINIGQKGQDSAVARKVYNFYISWNGHNYQKREINVIYYNGGRHHDYNIWLSFGDPGGDTSIEIDADNKLTAIGGLTGIREYRNGPDSGNLNPGYWRWMYQNWMGKNWLEYIKNLSDYNNELNTWNEKTKQYVLPKIPGYNKGESENGKIILKYIKIDNKAFAPSDLKKVKKYLRQKTAKELIKLCLE